MLRASGGKTCVASWKIVSGTVLRGAALVPGVPGGWAFVDYVCRYAYSDVASRLCLKTRERAIYIGETFIDDIKDWLEF